MGPGFRNKCESSRNCFDLEVPAGLHAGKGLVESRHKYTHAGIRIRLLPMAAHRIIIPPTGSFIGLKFGHETAETGLGKFRTYPTGSSYAKN